MNVEWYYAIGEDRKGPVDLTELRQLANDGILRPSDLVWNERLPDWVEARRIEELRGYGGRGWSRSDQQGNQKSYPRYENYQNDDPDQNSHRRSTILRTPPDISNQKITAGILALLLGQFGIHKFYLGFNNAGVIILVCTLVSWGLTVVSCGILAFLAMIIPIITFIEGILYLTKSERDFHYDYNIRKKEWF